MDKLARVLKEVPWMVLNLIMAGAGLWWISAIMDGNTHGAAIASLVGSPFILMATLKLSTDRLSKYRPDPEVAPLRELTVGLIALPIVGVAGGIWFWHMGAHLIGWAVGIAYPVFALYIFLDLRRALRREQEEE